MKCNLQGKKPKDIGRDKGCTKNEKKTMDFEYEYFTTLFSHFWEYFNNVVQIQLLFLAEYGLYMFCCCAFVFSTKIQFE